MIEYSSTSLAEMTRVGNFPNN